MGLNAWFKDLWYTKIKQAQIYYGEFNKYTLKAKNSPYTTRIFDLLMEFIKTKLSLKYILYSFSSSDSDGEDDYAPSKKTGTQLFVE